MKKTLGHLLGFEKTTDLIFFAKELTRIPELSLQMLGRDSRVSVRRFVNVD